MGIKHNPAVAESHASKIKSELGKLKNNPKAGSVSYSNLYGVTKGEKSNNELLDLIQTYVSASQGFTNKVNQVSKKFEALDKSAKFGEN